MLTSARDESAGLTTGQIEYQRALEKDIETRVIEILEPVVGMQKVRAKVAAAIDFSRVEKTEERFDPESQVVRSELRNTEKTTNGTTSGVPGVASNLPGKTQVQGASTQGLSEKKNETVNYEISRVTSRVVHHPGELKRLTVAVLVDGTSSGAAGSKEKQYKPRSEEDLKNFEEMVKKAVGFSAERGDEVRVVNMPFEVAAQEEFTAPKTEILPWSL
jgi:flagellar M-ring protein FliF